MWGRKEIAKHILGDQHDRLSSPYLNSFKFEFNDWHECILYGSSVGHTLFLQEQLVEWGEEVASIDVPWGN